MINALHLLAVSLSTPQRPVAFGYGTPDEMNVFADGHQTGFLLWHEGYLTATLSRLASGGIQDVYALNLLILSPSALADARAERSVRVAQLQAVAQQVYVGLDALGKLGPANLTTGLNLTDRNLDALRMALTLTTEVQSVC